MKSVRLLFLALALRLVPALLIRGTDDVSSWEAWGRMLAAGSNPYTTKYLFAWPPFWLPFAWFSYVTADMTGLPFAFIGKLFPIAADVALVFLLYLAAEEHGLNPYATAFAYAVNPVSIYTSAIHGNFDAIPALCLTAAVVSAGRRNARGAGMWVGVGAGFKTWPLLFLPAVIAPLRPFRARLSAGLAAIGIFVGAFLLALPFGTRAITEALAYRSASGWWGLSSLAFLRGGPIPAALFDWTFYGAMAAVALLLVVRRTPAAEGTLLLLLTFFLTTPGFGLQYLVWLVPVALLADRRRAIAFSALAAIVITWEVLARPYAGHIGDMVRMLPHAGYSSAYGGYDDQLYTVIGRLCLWAFVCYWWAVALAAQIFPACRSVPRSVDE